MEIPKIIEYGVFPCLMSMKKNFQNIHARILFLFSVVDNNNLTRNILKAKQGAITSSLEIPKLFEGAVSPYPM